MNFTESMLDILSQSGLDSKFCSNLRWILRVFILISSASRCVEYIWWTWIGIQQWEMDYRLKTRIQNTKFQNPKNRNLNTPESKILKTKILTSKTWNFENPNTKLPKIKRWNVKTQNPKTRMACILKMGVLGNIYVHIHTNYSLKR